MPNSAHIKYHVHLHSLDGAVAIQLLHSILEMAVIVAVDGFVLSVYIYITLKLGRNTLCKCKLLTTIYRVKDLPNIG